MSHIEQATGELRAMAAGVDKAQSSTAAADAKAEEIRGRAARSGFTGIAASLSRLRKTIAEIRTRLVSVGDSITQAVTAVAAIPKEVSPEHVVAVLGPVQQTMSSVRDQITASVAKVEATKQLAAAVLRGGRPGPMLSALEAIEVLLVLVARHGGAAEHHVRAAVDEARQIGGSGGLPAAGGEGSPSPAPARQPPELRWPGYPARRSLSWSDRRHIVYGDEDDPTSGGHLHGLNRPAKTEFPPNWDEDKIAQEVTSVAEVPDRVAERPGGMWRAVGIRDGVTIHVFLRRDGSIASGHPVSGPDVRQNPRSGGV